MNLYNALYGAWKVIKWGLGWITYTLREPFERSGHNPIEVSSSGTFMFPTIVGPFPAQLIVIGGEGNAPHFHISVNGIIFTSIRLDKPKYHFHKESYRYLSDEQLYAMISFLRSDPYGNMSVEERKMYGLSSKTEWERLVFFWKTDCRNKPCKSIDTDNPIMPDYSKLTTKPYVKWKHDNRKSFIHIL